MEQAGEIVVSPLEADRAVLHLEQAHAFEMEAAAGSRQPHEFALVGGVHLERLGDALAVDQQGLSADAPVGERENSAPVRIPGSLSGPRPCGKSG